MGKKVHQILCMQSQTRKNNFEIDGVTEDVAREALYKASAKLPIKTKFIKDKIMAKKRRKKLTKDQAEKDSNVKKRFTKHQI